MTMTMAFSDTFPKAGRTGAWTRAAVLVCLAWLAWPVAGQVPRLSWTFDGTLEDASGTGNHGVAEGGEARFVDGRFGRALARPAGLVVRCAEAKGLPTRAASPWSLNLWLRVETAVPGWAQIGGFRDGSNAWGSLRFADNEGGFSFYGHNTTLCSGVPWLADDQWHMYSLTWDGNRVRLYVDGVLKRAGAPGTMEFSGLADLQGPVAVVLGDALWAGSADEFTLWDIRLSDVQVAGLFAANRLPAAADPAGR